MHARAGIAIGPRSFTLVFKPLVLDATGSPSSPWPTETASNLSEDADLGFKTEYITDFQEFCELLGVIGRYNAFHPVKVITELRPIFPKLMGVEIGREGSPVIYGYPAYWTHQEVRWQGTEGGTRIPDEERIGVSRSFLDAMGRAHADELTDSGHSLRAWWD